MVKLTKKDLAIIGGLVGVADFLAEGRLSAPLSRALKRTAIAAGKKAIFTAPAAARVAQASALRGAGTVARVGAMVAMRHPYVAAGAVIYVAAKNREQIADLIRDGYDVIPGGERRREFIEDPVGFIQDVRSEMTPGVGPFGLGRPLGAPIPGMKPKRRKSTYNTSVSKAMKAIKKSTSYGIKGALNNPKKAFGFVARTVSKLRKGKKVSNKGASGVVKRALPGISKIEVRK
jgi:hypothetical protein